MWCIKCMCALLCIIVNVQYTLARNSWSEKTLGEMWAAVIKTINNLLRRSVASSVGAPKWGQSRSQYIPRRGACRTCSRGASRRPKPKYVHYQYTCIHLEILILFLFSLKHTYWKANIQDMYCSICTCNYRQRLLSVLMHKLYSGVYFLRLKINHESYEFILDPGTVANINKVKKAYLGDYLAMTEMPVQSRPLSALNCPCGSTLGWWKIISINASLIHRKNLGMLQLLVVWRRYKQAGQFGWRPDRQNQTWS